MLGVLSGVFLFHNPRRHCVVLGIFVLVAVYSIVLAHTLSLVANSQHHGIDSLLAFEADKTNDSSTASTPTDAPFPSSAAPTTDSGDVVASTSPPWPSPSR
ncbi:hypothetical protein QR680_009102 [Steinernema hermaphroditum]|uniref:Uncharacterized protein n=1 Tax=Steinernema hermaphroditum TaxID=289476 RepID=A0AA39IKD6_9BILA|nr:hypothetical protein QR680_009102 [Steinernema hermaphroditum]